MNLVEKDLEVADFIPQSSSWAAPPCAYPLREGAHLVGDGIDVAVYAGLAKKVEVCFFSPSGQCTESFSLHRQLHGLWAGHIPGISVGARYGFRVFGHWDPDSGMLYNPAKVLLDPYARVLAQTPTLHPALYGKTVDKHFIPDPDMQADKRDSAPFAALGMVTPPDEKVDSHPRIPWNDTVIYEAHVVGLTKNLPGVPPELRGTYAGAAHPATIAHLKRIGITALELLPIHAKFSEPFLAQRGLENYWGYNTLSFFAPEPSYASAAAQAAGPLAILAEIKGMVELLHTAGIEVILDVVYNHTCEGGKDGPSLSWRGLDNTGYYRHDSHHPGVLKDTTGCGNSLDFRRDTVIKMTLDSLRYWVEVVGVDGFRFDLAVTLGREGDSFNHNHPLYVAMASDPILSSVKLINEPWDIGYGGWQTGGFPIPTADWNDRFRDSLRSFWVAQPRAITAGTPGTDLRDLATRLSGSADLFGRGRVPGGRGIYASINFITAHDGFTMRDLVSYNDKHNELNKEDNKDGTGNNLAWNHGIEGDTTNREIQKNRQKTIRNLFGSLLLSAGTPMITAGDEIGKTQLGNNNAYCQNSPISWLNWDIDPDWENITATVAYLTELRRQHPVLRPQVFYTGEAISEGEVRDLEWFNKDGQPMEEYSWFDNSIRTLQMLRAGGKADGDALLVLNGNLTAQEITLPQGQGKDFTLVWSSEWETPQQEHIAYAPGSSSAQEALSLRLYFTSPPE